MTRSPFATRLAAGILLSVTAGAWAQQPTDVVTSDAGGDTAMGLNALYSLTSGGGGNTAAGSTALFSETSGYGNSAFGTDALEDSTVTYYNSAFGYEALLLTTTGSYNSGFGGDALLSNTTGSLNTAVGDNALQFNTTGSGNTGTGAGALFFNTIGANNTAFGYSALFDNTTGKGNAAQGVNALYNNTTGIRNLGIGSNALYTNSTGSYNIALGFDAGYNVANGSNNIEIGYSGTAADNGVIQIGVQGTQTATTIAGIYGTPVTGSAVYVSATGQLGVMGSSERFKTDIAPMAELSGKLSRLRPVTFHYKTDPKGIQQYGLIAEEVDKVYPELVIRDDKGRIHGVHYEELAPMLLKEIQLQQAEIAAEKERDARQLARIAALEAEMAQMNDFKQSMMHALRDERSRDALLAADSRH